MIHGNFSRVGFLLLSTSLSVVAATYTVDTALDDQKADCITSGYDCSLRGAMMTAVSGDTIDFNLSPSSVIVLGDPLPSIDDKNLTIDGSTVSGVTISGDNSYHPFHINRDSNVTIQGLSIVAGVGNSEGGAIFNEGNLTIIESTLSGNTDVEGKGGAIYNKSGATLKIVDSNITSNISTEYYSSYGGAIHSEGKVTISGSRIVNNTSQSSYGSYGGAIHMQSSTLEISDSTISGNNSDHRGGAICLFDSNLDVNNSIISDNNASSYGGGIFVSNGHHTIQATTISGNKSQYSGGGIYMDEATFEIQTSNILDNNAQGYGGGGVYAYGSELTISSSTISNNSTTSTGGGLYSGYYSNTTIKNSTISGNSARNVGAVFQGSSSMKITHSTIVNNKETGSSNKSGGISFTGNSSFKIKNSIITGNTTPSGNKDCFHGDYYITSEGYNIVQAPGNCDFTASGDLTGTAPNIGSLADNGGSTKTHAIIPEIGNPAWNTGACDDIANDPVITDQRGEARPELGGSDCDIGAFEFGEDTDSDGLDYLTETVYGTDPTVADSDIDGLDDGEEVYQYKTDPLKFDTDGDGVGDGDEIAAGTDPLDPNSYPIIDISPIEFLFGTTSGTTDFTITNTTVNDITLPSAALQGPDGGSSPSGFSIDNDACVGTLPAGQSCTIQVAYPASSNESRSAFLQIEDVNLTAFVHNYEGVREEAVRRLPAVVGDLDFNPEMQTNNAETINWSFVGYDDHNYTAYIALFDCTGVAAGECATSYNSPQRFDQGLNLQPDSVENTSWSYNGQEMKKYNYSFTFTPDHVMPIVMRFYYQSGLDTNLGLQSISTIISGGFLYNGEPYDYYDTSGRKISADVTDSINQ